MSQRSIMLATSRQAFFSPGHSPASSETKSSQQKYVNVQETTTKIVRLIQLLASCCWFHILRLANSETPARFRHWAPQAPHLQSTAHPRPGMLRNFCPSTAWDQTLRSFGGALLQNIRGLFHWLLPKRCLRMLLKNATSCSRKQSHPRSEALLEEESHLPYWDHGLVDFPAESDEVSYHIWNILKK